MQLTKLINYYGRANQLAEAKEQPKPELTRNRSAPRPKGHRQNRDIDRIEMMTDTRDVAQARQLQG
jgi:hypothetical protein